MPLDDLVQVIEILQQRIRDHGDSLRQNEIRTRVALIDPLLTALGWDVSDPGLVTAEYGVAGGRADYAFWDAGHTPAATLEAKKLGEALDPHRLQMLNYSNAAGIRFAGLTDGNVWELYEIFKQGSLEERRILNVALASEAAFQCALKLLLLWRPNLATGRAINANEPILQEVSVPSLIEETRATFARNRDVALGRQVEEKAAESWQQLSDLEIVPGDDPPAAIRFPTGEEFQIRIWRQLVEVTLTWLWNTGLLSLNNVPVRSSSKRYLVNLQPRHPGGNGFKTVCPVPETPLYIDGNISAKASASNAKRVLQYCGQDPAAVRFKTR